MASLFGVEALRQLVQVVDDLRDVGLARIISLPRIVVVGTQSSGKSSVLESIVGMDFLPRGDGVVTRRPLELRLVHISESEAQGTAGGAWAIFEEEKQVKYTDFDKVREKIESLTDEVSGVNKGIVDNPIILNVYSSTCPNLTLVDLPGVTRVPLKGSDQGEDIEAITRNMAAKYIQDSRTIILAVISANQDMSTSDALQLARRYDPEGVRTIGVLTKLDLMDQGTDAVRMVRGDDIHLHLGYVAVKNRSKADITAKKKVSEALEEEKQWFKNHKTYGQLPPGFTGIEALVGKLTKVLFTHIRRFLPDIKRDVLDRKHKVEADLRELGDGVPADLQVRTHMMWTDITTYCDMMNSSIRGKFDPRLRKYMAKETETNEPRCGAQIRGKFNDLLALEHSQTVTHKLSDDDINRALRDLEGDALPGFPSPDTFEMLVTPHLQKLGAPCIELLNAIACLLTSLAHRMASLVFTRFPQLAERVFEIASHVIEEEKNKTRIVIENLVGSTSGYLFTNDDEYLTNHGLMKNPNGNEELMNSTQQQNGQQQQQIPPPPSHLEPTGMRVNGQPLFGEKPAGAGQQPLFGENQKLVQAGVSAAMFESQKMAQSSVSAVRGGFQSMFSSEGQMGGKKQLEGYSAAFVGEIRKRLDAYFKLCVGNIRDTVPKAVGYNLVRNVQNKLAFTLHQKLANPDQFLSEPPHIAEERKALAAQVEILVKAAAVLSSRNIELS